NHLFVTRGRTRKEICFSWSGETSGVVHQWLYFWMQWYFPAVAWCLNSLFNYANGSIALSCRATFSRHEETDPGPGIVLSAGIVKRFRAKGSARPNRDSRPPGRRQYT